MDNVDNVDKYVFEKAPISTKTVETLIFPTFSGLYTCVLYELENPQSFHLWIVENFVDNVDNLSGKQVFPYFYNISGTHSYQQVAVHTFF